MNAGLPIHAQVAEGSKSLRQVIWDATAAKAIMRTEPAAPPHGLTVRQKLFDLGTGVLAWMRKYSCLDYYYTAGWVELNRPTARPVQFSGGHYSSYHEAVYQSAWGIVTNLLSVDGGVWLFDDGMPDAEYIDRLSPGTRAEIKEGIESAYPVEEIGYIVAMLDLELSQALLVCERLPSNLIRPHLDCKVGEMAAIHVHVPVTEDALGSGDQPRFNGNSERDAFILEEYVKGTSLAGIMALVNRNKEWGSLSHEQSVDQAISRYCRRLGMKNRPRRKES